METPKFYFEDEDSERCYHLDYFVRHAREEGLTEIELFEAVPDTLNTEMSYCKELEDVVELSTCNEECEYFEASEEGACKMKGILMEWGEKVKFDISTDQPVQICYKTDKPCQFNCSGLCKESY